MFFISWEILIYAWEYKKKSWAVLKSIMKKHDPCLKKYVLAAFINILHICFLPCRVNTYTVCLFIIAQIQLLAVWGFQVNACTASTQTSLDLYLCFYPTALSIQLPSLCMKTSVRAEGAMQLSRLLMLKDRLLLAYMYMCKNRKNTETFCFLYPLLSLHKCRLLAHSWPDGEIHSSASERWQEIKWQLRYPSWISLQIEKESMPSINLRLQRPYSC